MNKTAQTEAPRYLPLQTVSVRISSESIPHHDPVFGIVANISQTGACLIVNRAVPLDTTVELDVELASQATRMRMSAHVVWCAERLEPVKEIVGYLAGVSFLDSREHVEKLLASGIFQLVP